MSSSTELQPVSPARRRLFKLAALLVGPCALLVLFEVVAGIIERGDEGEEGVRRRAAAEVAEEAGFSVSPDALEFLGAGTFATSGTMPEKFWLLSVKVDPTTAGALTGDGSPMEEGASTRWMDLDEVIAACMAGEIEDAKTELVARRLRDALVG